MKYCRHYQNVTQTHGLNTCCWIRVDLLDVGLSQTFNFLKNMISAKYNKVKLKKRHACKFWRWLLIEIVANIISILNSSNATKMKNYMHKLKKILWIIYFRKQKIDCNYFYIFDILQHMKLFCRNVSDGTFEHMFISKVE